LRWDWRIEITRDAYVKGCPALCLTWPARLARGDRGADAIAQMLMAAAHASMAHDMPRVIVLPWRTSVDGPALAAVAFSRIHDESSLSQAVQNGSVLGLGFDDVEYVNRSPQTYSAKTPLTMQRNIAAPKRRPSRLPSTFTRIGAHTRRHLSLVDPINDYEFDGISAVNRHVGDHIPRRRKSSDARDV